MCDQQEGRKLLHSALEDGDRIVPSILTNRYGLKRGTRGHSLIIGDTGLIGKVGHVREIVREMGSAPVYFNA